MRSTVLTYTSRRIAGLIAGILAGLFLIAGPGILTAEDAEDKLLQGELLEVSAGDLEKAMAIYRAVEADPSAPPSARARALLYIARCQRKRGEIEGAKKTLEALVAGHAKERDVIRQAQGFLRELQSGRAENPEFDWLKELEKSPEIQARVFDLAMDLVDKEQAGRAKRQLLALGTIALPVIDRMIETSRDPEHRRHLALIAVRAGKLERLAAVLDATPATRFDEGLMEFAEMIPAMSAEEKKRLLDVLAGLAVSPGTDPYRDFLRLKAGDRTDLAAKLGRLEPFGYMFITKPLVEDILRSEPSAAEFLAARILDPTPGRLGARSTYLRVLLEMAPDKLGDEHLELLEELAAGNQSVEVEKHVELLDKRGSFEPLVRLARGKAGKAIIKAFWEKYGNERLATAPPGWAPVLRALAEPQGKISLHALAEANDGAVPELASFLRARAKEAPDYKGYGRRGSSRIHGSGIADPDWRPSPRYADAMAALLDSGDPVTLAIALEALALAPAGVGPEVLPVLEKLVLSPPDPHVREFALYALLGRLPSRPETGPAAAKVLLGDFTLSRGHAFPQAEFQASPLMGVSLGVIRDRHDRKTLVLLFPQAIETAGLDQEGGFLAWLLSQLSPADVAPTITASLPSLDTTAERAALIRVFRSGSQNGSFLAAAPGGLEFLRAAALDAGVPPELRMKALDIAGEAAIGWFDWPETVLRTDAMLDHLPWGGGFSDHLVSWIRGLPEEKRKEFDAALAASPQASLRAWRLRNLSVFLMGKSPEDRPNLAVIIEQGLEDRDAQVQGVALGRALDIGEPRLLIKAIRTPAGKQDEKLHAALQNLASPDSIEPLVALLNDPDSKVRDQALATLKAIRTVLEERKQWEELVKGMKKP